MTETQSALETTPGPVEIVPAAPSDLSRAAATLAAAFSVDPHVVGLLPRGDVGQPLTILWQRIVRETLDAGGHVVVVNSGAGRAAKPDRGAYSASKFAARAVADTLRAEEPELRVTSIYPGRVDTGMQRALVAADGDEYRPERYLAPESVAAAVRAALESGPDAHPTDVVLRPRHG